MEVTWDENGQDKSILYLTCFDFSLWTCQYHESERNVALCMNVIHSEAYKSQKHLAHRASAYEETSELSRVQTNYKPLNTSPPEDQL